MSSNADRISDASQPQEDVAGLFARFGGDASSYREFESKNVPTPPRAVASVPAVAPTPPDAEPRELDVLFSRLAGVPLPGVDTAHPLMARWRRST